MPTFAKMGIFMNLFCALAKILEETDRPIDSSPCILYIWRKILKGIVCILLFHQTFGRQMEYMKILEKKLILEIQIQYLKKNCYLNMDLSSDCFWWWWWRKKQHMIIFNRREWNSNKKKFCPFCPCLAKDTRKYFISFWRQFDSSYINRGLSLPYFSLFEQFKMQRFAWHS